MPLGLGLGITKLKSLVSGLRVRFQGNATITAALDGILRDLSADFVSNGTVTAALEAIKLLDVDFSGEGTLTADLASFTGLLDDYPNAAAAYSIRLLSSTYSGALVEIRRSSDNALKSFYPDSNNELSLNSEDGSSTTLSSWIGSDNGFVRTWHDQSGNSNAIQTSAANQPQIINAGSLLTYKGKASILYNGTTQQLLVNSLPTFSINEQYYIIGQGFCTSGRGAQTLRGGSFWRDNATRFRYLNGGNQYHTTAVETDNLLVIQLNSSDSDLYLNNVQSTESGTITPTYNTALTIGAAPAVGTYHNSYISEFVLFSNINDRTGKQTNINDFYTIY